MMQNAAVSTRPDVVIRGFEVPGPKPVDTKSSSGGQGNLWSNLFETKAKGKPEANGSVGKDVPLPVKRRGSVVLHNRNALLIDEALEDKTATTAITATNAKLLQTPTPVPSRASSPGPMFPAQKKNAKKSKKAKNKKQIRPALVDEGIAISSSSTSPDTVVRGFSEGAATPQLIAFPKGLATPRSNVSSLSSSFQDRRAAFPLTLDTSKLSSATQKLVLNAGDIISVEGRSGESYEVQLEEDFMSPDVRKKSPLQDMFDNDRGVTIATEKEGNKMYADDFETLKMLGKGSYGTVLLVRHKATGRLYAQKQLKKASLIVHKKLVDQTKAERNILESVRHPFVVKLFYAFQDHKKLYLILEYAQGGELFNYLATENMFPEATTAFYIAELVLALTHLHDNVGVVYRDLKPENCLLDAEGHLLMTDFGLSKVAEDGARCKSVLGTPEYMAPEILQGKPYGFEVDWWSLGALTYDLLTGSPPFPGNNHTAILSKIQKSKPHLPYYLSAEAKDLLLRLLRKEPTKRLGSNMPKDLLTIKSHRFFRRIDWKKLERRECVAPIKPLVTDPELAENFASEFTEAQMSPVVERGAWGRDAAFNGGKANGGNGGSYGSWMERREEDPFGGFSFQAGSVMDGYFRDF